MELRKLKALLGALRAAGVASYRDGDLTVQFGAPLLQAPTGDVDGDVGDLDLPPGVLDAQAALAKIRKAYEPKGKAS